MSKKILFGITGGIAAYKSIELINTLQKDGHQVKVIATSMGLKFVTTLTLQTISKNTVFTDEFEIKESNLAHIELSKWADLVIIAPATANTLAKLANGLADNLLTTSILALPTKTPIYIAPAMNTRMWDNPLTQDNLEKLQKFYSNLTLIPPRESILACGEQGIGAMANPGDIYNILKGYL